MLKHCFTLVDLLTQGASFTVELFLPHLHHVKRLHQLIDRLFACAFQVGDDLLGRMNTVPEGVRLGGDALDVRYEIIHVSVELFLDLCSPFLTLLLRNDSFLPLA